MTWDNRRPHKITFCFHVLQQEFHSKIYVFINPLRYFVGEKVLIIDTEDRKLAKGMNLRCYTVVAGEPDVAFLAFTPPRPYKDHKNILFLLFWALGSTRNER